jgi:hypothetical protein
MLGDVCSAPDNETNAKTQERFLKMLPAIHRQAHYVLRGYDEEVQQELIADVVANCYCAYCRLVERGQEGRAYATPLTDYAIRRVRAGRRVGQRWNVRDVSSAHCQREKGVTLERLDRRDAGSRAWQEVLVKDRRSGPAEIAALRLDFRAWLAALPERTRRVAECLATGETTSVVARMFGITPGRISQLRRELHQAWLSFQNESLPAAL